MADKCPNKTDLLRLAYERGIKVTSLLENNPRLLCETITALDDTASGTERRLASLVAPSDDTKLDEKQRTAWQKQQKLWPEAQSLDKDVSAMCREFFVEENKPVAKEEWKDRLALLTNIAAIFYGTATQPSTTATAAKVVSDKSTATLASPTKSDTFEPNFQEQKRAVEWIENYTLSRYGARALKSKDGSLLKETATICLLLSHPFVLETMRRVGPVQHLDEATIDRIRKVESEVARDYTMQSKTWKNTFEALAKHLPSWQQAKSFLLFSALLFAPGALQGATAQEVSVTGLVPSAMPQVGPGAFSTSVTYQNANTIDGGNKQFNLQFPEGKLPKRDPRPMAPGGGVILPSQTTPAQFKEMISRTARVQQILDASKDPKERAEKMAQNMCLLFLGGQLTASAGECDLGDGVILSGLPKIENPEMTEPYAVYQDFFGDWFGANNWKRNGNQAQVITPSGQILKLLLSPDTRKHGAAVRVLSILTPALFSLGELGNINFNVLPGGEILLPNSESKLSQMRLEGKGRYQGEFLDLSNPKSGREHCRFLLEHDPNIFGITKTYLLAPEEAETAEMFADREARLHIFLKRCATDIIELEEFFNICPKEPVENLPVECTEILERLQSRVMADFQTKKGNEAAQTTYKKFLTAISDEDQAASLIPPTLMQELQKYSKKEKEWLEQRWNKHFNLIVDLPDGLSDEEREKREHLFARIVLAITPKAALLDRLAELLSNYAAAGVNLVAFAFLLKFLSSMRRNDAGNNVRAPSASRASSPTNASSASRASSPTNAPSASTQTFSRALSPPRDWVAPVMDLTEAELFRKWDKGYDKREVLLFFGEKITMGADPATLSEEFKKYKTQKIFASFIAETNRKAVFEFLWNEHRKCLIEFLTSLRRPLRCTK